MVIFLQGCSLRCAYCHNPDSWDLKGGTEASVEELVERAIRMKDYFGDNGGVTISGGEPLLQAKEVLELLRALKRNGIHTAVDTAGVEPDEMVTQVIAEADLLLVDLKAGDEKSYKSLTGGNLEACLRFLDEAGALGKRIWIRHVLVPGVNDGQEERHSLEGRLRKLLERGIRLDRIEILPYHSMGVCKYEKMGISYKLHGVEDMRPEKALRVEKELRACLGFN